MALSPGAVAQAATVVRFGLPGAVGLEARIIDSADHVPAARIASAGRMLALVEPERDEESIASVSRAVLHEIMQHYYSGKGRPLVGTLVQALKLANADLRRRNLTKSLRERIGLGVAIVVLRDDELQFCVVPPARVYVVQGGDVLSVGAGSYSGISSHSPFVRQMPLGLSDEVDPDLARIKAESGTLVVLCSPNLGRLLLMLDEEELFLLGDADSLANRLRDMARGRELVGGALLAVEVTAPLSVRDTLGISDWLAKYLLGARLWKYEPVEAVSSLRRRREIPRSSGQSNSRLVGNLRHVQLLRTSIGILGRLSLPNFLRRDQLPRLRSIEPRIPVKKSRRWLRYTALIMVFLILAAFGIKWEFDRSRAARVEELLAEARRLSQEAAQEQDKTLAEQKYRRASELLDEAASIRVNSEQVGSLLSQVDESLDALSGIYRLRLPQLVLDASPLGERSSLKQIVPSARHIYILDQGLGAVLDFDQKAMEVRQLLGVGDDVGGLQVGQPLALGSFGDTLWMLDVNMQIFVRSGADGSWRGLKIPDTENWGTPLDVAYWGGSLYVLTSNPNQIYRVNIGNLGAGGEPWLDNPADARQATALSVDGRIFMLTSSGTVQRAVRGTVDAEFEVRLDPPLAGASQIFTWSDVGSLFILDPARERIVEVLKDGKNARQILAPTGSQLLNDIRSIAYDAGTDSLYIVSSHQIWIAQIPPWR